MKENVAIIDLGSNSVRLTVWSINEDGSFRVLDKAKEIVRLSEGMSNDMNLKPGAMKRALEALRIFSHIIKTHNVTRIYAVGTAAVRQAVNRDTFLDRVRRETGLEIRVITGDEEAAYAVTGVINSIPEDDFVMIDTGGASTELVLVKNRRILHSISIPIGAVNLTEKFITLHEKRHNDKSRETGRLQQWKDMEHYVLECLNNVSWLEDARELPIVGIGGSIRALAKIHKKRTGYPFDSIHGYQMSAEEVMNESERIIKLPINERRLVPGLDKDRADIISGGFAPIRCLVEYIKAPCLTISECGLREGLMYKSMTQGDPIIPDILEYNLNNIVKVYHQDLTHAKSVKNLALQLFDQLEPLHGVSNNYRSTVAAAAMLHDIGQMVNYEDHEKHGYYLMLNTRVYGLTHREQILAAYLVAMHRIKDYKCNLKDFSPIISDKDSELLEKLSVIIKMAEKMDRNEYGHVNSVTCYISKDAIEMVLNSEYNTLHQASAVMKNEKTFKKVFNRKLIIL